MAITMTRVILIRHCEAEGNIKRIFQGHIDSDISENGKRQLVALARRFRDIKLDYIYSSPLLRARKTAEAVAHGMELRLCDGLMEIKGGVWEGKPWASFPTLYPEQARNWNLSPWEFHPAGGESMRELYERIWRTVLRIVQSHEGGQIGVVSHGCAIRNFLCRAHGRPIEDLNEICWCDNTALSMIDFDSLWRPAVVSENDASHLSAELSTLNKQSWWRPEARAAMLFE